jgi:hypothetical protein
LLDIWGVRLYIKKKGCCVPQKQHPIHWWNQKCVKSETSIWVDNVVVKLIGVLPPGQFNHMIKVDRTTVKKTPKADGSIFKPEPS